MKLVLTKTELIAIARMTMTIPGVMKKILTDKYIISEFEKEMKNVTDKTTAIKFSRTDDEYTVEIIEVMVVELVNEFGSLINAIITLTIGTGARVKMMVDKYKIEPEVKVVDTL